MRITIPCEVRYSNIDDGSIHIDSGDSRCNMVFYADEFPKQFALLKPLAESKEGVRVIIEIAKRS